MEVVYDNPSALAQPAGKYQVSRMLARKERAPSARPAFGTSVSEEPDVRHNSMKLTCSAGSEEGRVAA
jgi:hypothetical protein